MANHGSRISPQVIGAGFEFVEFFDDIEGNDHLVLFEHEQRVGIVQQDVGVENEMLDVAVLHGGWLLVAYCLLARQPSAIQLATSNVQQAKSNMPLYPLKFKPRLLEKMWGGRKLQSLLGKNLPPDKMIGESWELYDFPPGAVEGETGWVSSADRDGPACRANAA